MTLREGLAMIWRRLDAVLLAGAITVGVLVGAAYGWLTFSEET